MRRAELNAAYLRKLGLAWGLAVSLVSSRLGAQELQRGKVKVDTSSLPGPLQACLAQPQGAVLTRGGTLGVPSEGGGFCPLFASKEKGVPVPTTLRDPVVRAPEVDGGAVGSPALPSPGRFAGAGQVWLAAP